MEELHDKILFKNIPSQPIDEKHPIIHIINNHLDNYLGKNQFFNVIAVGVKQLNKIHILNDCFIYNDISIKHKKENLFSIVEYDSLIQVLEKIEFFLQKKQSDKQIKKIIDEIVEIKKRDFLRSLDKNLSCNTITTKKNKI